MKQKINYTEDSGVISEAVKSANSILENKDFHEELSSIESFNNSNASGKIISELIKESSLEAYIELYSKTLTRANAYTIPRKPKSIFLNNKRLNRSIGSIAATLVHEYIHLLDFANEEYWFGHSSNRRRGNGETAPHKIDNLVYRLLTNKTPKEILQDDEDEMPHLEDYTF